MERIIFHVDVNNAFLSWTAVYLLNKGYEIDIRTIASVIGGDEEKRHGIVLAKSQVAKKYNIHTAETLYLARKKCPNLKIYPPDFEEYYRQSMNLYHYLEQYTPSIEQASIDECYLDLSKTKYLYDDILKLAYKIKKEIKDLYGFTVNVGIGNNKLCAKMASDFEKPDKVHTLFMEEIPNKMWPLDVGDLLYIGKSSSEILHNIGIKTIGDLAHTEENYLRKYFKNRAKDLIMASKGIDDTLVEKYIPKSKGISISRTLIKDTNNEQIIKRNLLDMADELGIRARKDKLYAQVVAITYKDSKMNNFSHQKKMLNPTNNTMIIYNGVLELYQQMDRNVVIRNIGIRLSDMTSKNTKQVSFFEEDNHGQDEHIQKIIDDINEKCHSTKIMPAIFFKKE